METVIIKRFKEKDQDRVRFIRILVEYSEGMGLRSAKESMDQMLGGKPIKYKIEEDRLADFKKELESLNLEYETT